MEVRTVVITDEPGPRRKTVEELIATAIARMVASRADLRVYTHVEKQR